jgi:alkylation response protein AidB-like acyl-CoA dehydrogenase
MTVIQTVEQAKTTPDIKRNGRCEREAPEDSEASTATTSTVSRGGDWEDRARSLDPAVVAWRDTGEQERHMPRPLFEAVRDAGLFSLSVPRALGGAEVGDATVLRVIEELSSQDGSVGWNVMIASHMAVIASYLPEKAAAEIYRGGASTVIAGALPPKGVAIPVAGGFRVRGRWPFGSGCHQADWMCAPSIVMENGTPRLRTDSRPETRALFLPVADCEILDTWYTTGLRGTGSHDWQVDDVFVPEHRSFHLFFEHAPVEPRSLSLPNFKPYADAHVAAVALGIARCAIDSFKKLATTKMPLLATSTLAAQHTVHERLGRAEALLRSARSFLYETVRELPRSPNWSAEVSDELSAPVRLASAHAAQNAAEVVDLMYAAAGTTSIYSSSRLERCFRDVHVVTQHVGVAPSNIEMVGQYFLGLGLQARR